MSTAALRTSCASVSNPFSVRSRHDSHIIKLNFSNDDAPTIKRWSCRSPSRNESNASTHYLKRSSTVALAGNGEGEKAALAKRTITGSDLLRIVIGILTAGFIDAGYSGDWSRIGVLTLDQESQLRTAAFFVVPASLSVIWKLSRTKVDDA